MVVQPLRLIANPPKCFHFEYGHVMAMGSTKLQSFPPLPPTRFVGRTVLQRWLTGASRRRIEREGRHLGKSNQPGTISDLLALHTRAKSPAMNVPPASKGCFFATEQMQVTKLSYVKFQWEFRLQSFADIYFFFQLICIAMISRLWIRWPVPKGLEMNAGSPWGTFGSENIASVSAKSITFHHTNFRWPMFHSSKSARY